MKDIENFLSGRIWLRAFTPFPKEQIDSCIELGKIAVLPGITPQRVCGRCQEKSPHKIKQFHCHKCNSVCYYCRHCIRMGRVSSCTELITWAVSPLKSPKSHSFVWNGQLTPSQHQASIELTASLQNQTSHLIYAVCGAGKTELLFPAIFESLKRGLRVCVAAPRTDVVLELSPRFRAVFPDTVIHTLYGGSPHEEGYADLIIATTHQLYRFHQAFDVMIVDEADAFPYSYDQTLKSAVMKAKKETALIVYVSATPSAELLKTVPSRSEIFRRFHGNPLPEPRFVSLWNYKKSFSKNKIPAKLLEWIRERLEKKEPFLLFLPTIELINSCVELFKGVDPRIEAVHASDPDRKQKVLKLREGTIPGVLTSTILERGITIPNVQVAVVGADEAIFNAAALIQIAGRVGRSAEKPTGDVVFYHDGIVREMDTAKRMIAAYNRRDGK